MGCICTYEGKVSPVATEEEQEDEFEQNKLYVNWWDFLASLNRMLSMNDESYEMYFEEPGVYLSADNDILE